MKLIKNQVETRRQLKYAIYHLRLLNLTVLSEAYLFYVTYVILMWLTKLPNKLLASGEHLEGAGQQWPRGYPLINVRWAANFHVCRKHEDIFMTNKYPQVMEAFHLQYHDIFDIRTKIRWQIMSMGDDYICGIFFFFHMDIDQLFGFILLAVTLVSPRIRNKLKEVKAFTHSRTSL